MHQLLFAPLQTGHGRRLRRQSFADPRQGRLLILSVVAYHARQVPAAQTAGPVFQRLLFQSAQPLRMRLFGLSSPLPALRPSVPLPDRCLAHLPFVLRQRAPTGLPALDQFPRRLQKHPRVLAQPFDERPTVAASAEAVGQLPIDGMVHPFQDRLLAPLDQEAAKHGDHGKAEGQRRGIEGLGQTVSDLAQVLFQRSGSRPK